MTECPADVSVLEALIGNDRVILGQFLRDYRAGAMRIVEELKAALAAERIAQLSAAAHRQESSASSVGASKLAVLCERIEQAGKSGDRESVIKLLPGFEEEVAAVETYLAAWPHDSTEH